MGFLLEALRELGREDGRDFNFTGRFAEFNVEQLPALAEEIVQLNPAVIVCGAVHGCGGPQATSSIPILSGSRRCHPPRASRQLCPPGWECDRHHALMSKDSPPSSWIGTRDRTRGQEGRDHRQPERPESPPQQHDLEAAARAAAIELVAPKIAGPPDIERAINQVANERVDVAVVLQTTMMLGQR